MDAIVDTLIARIDHPRAGSNGMQLPPGHPDVSGAASGAAGGLPPGHPDISGGASGMPPGGSGGGGTGGK
jgi:hypothetical protein